MEETAREVIEYLQENLWAMIPIAVFAGFAASKTVAWAKRGNILMYILVGVLGAFLGRYAILYLDLEGIIGALPQFRFVFDFIAAYVGAFVVAAIINFLKPL